METLVIAFGHKARHGKNTATRAIVDARGDKYDIREYAFANALKREVNEAAEKHGGMLALFTHLARHSRLPSWVQYEPSPDMSDPLCPLGKQRTLLQWWGTEYRRAEDPYYWVKQLKKTLEAERPRVALISDMRFLNEAAWVIKDKWNRTVRVDRHGFQDIATSSHQSEHELDKFKYHYELNVQDGNVEELRKDAVWIFDHIAVEQTLQEDVSKFPEEVIEYAHDEAKEEAEAPTA